MASVGIRVVDDVETLATLRRLSVEEVAGGPVDDPDFETRFAAWWEDEFGRRTTWVAFAARDPIGMLNLAEFRRMPRPGLGSVRWGYVANVFVVAAHRNGGVGRALLDAAVAEARTRGYVRLLLNPSERSIPFYRRAGFRPADSLLVLPLESES